MNAKEDASVTSGKKYYVATSSLIEFIEGESCEANYTDIARESRLAARTVSNVFKKKRCSNDTAKAIVNACKEFGYKGDKKTAFNETY